MVIRARYEYMKTILTLVVVGVFTGAFQVSAQDLQSVEATQLTPQQGRVHLDSDSDVAAEGDLDQPIVTGEDQTTTTQPEWTDYNISDPGVTDEDEENSGTEQTDIGFTSETQLNESDEDRDTDIIDIGEGVPQENRAGYLKIGDIKGESGVVAEEVTSDLFVSELEDEAKESGEKGGTEDIIIDDDELQEARSGYVKIGDIKGETQETRAIYVEIKGIDGESDDSGSSQAKKPKEIVVVGSKVREAVEAGVVVRGWDPEKKEARIGADDVKTEDDLVDYAAGILASDELVSNIEIADSSIGVEIRQQVKLFGIFPAQMELRVDVATDPDEEGRVKVKFPWWAFLAGGALSAEEIETAIETDLADNVEVEQEQGSEQKYQSLSNILKVATNVL